MSPQPAPPAVTVRYFAGARAAAGTTEEKVDTARDTTLASLLTHLVDLHGQRLGAIVPACSFLVDGVAWHDHHAPMPDAATVDILPPFAGG